MIEEMFEVMQYLGVNQFISQFTFHSHSIAQKLFKYAFKISTSN